MTYVFSLERAAVSGCGDEQDTVGQHRSDDGGSDYMNIHTYEAVLPGETSKQLHFLLTSIFPRLTGICYICS